MSHDARRSSKGVLHDTKEEKYSFHPFERIETSFCRYRSLVPDDAVLISPFIAYRSLSGHACWSGALYKPR